MTPLNKLLVICGPTASGKSDLALAISQKFNGSIVNADCLQIYEEIPIIASSPDDNTKGLAPHYLYNYLPINSYYSVAKYLKEALKSINYITSQGRLPIVVGGSGMYINSLIYGLSPVPEVSEGVKDEVNREILEYGVRGVYNKLQLLDHEVTLNLHTNDKQRIIRAYEVMKQTGKSLLYFQNLKRVNPLTNYDIQTIMLLPRRELLYQICNERFLKLLEIGGYEEVYKLYKAVPELASSAAKAIGVKELYAYFRGEINYNIAVDLAQQHTRNYAKRQITWFLNQLPDKKILAFNTLTELHEVVEGWSFLT